MFVCLGLSSCGFPGAPAHSTVQFTEPGASQTVSTGAIAEYTCDRGFELLGPARRVCGENGTWSPQGIPFCGKFSFHEFSDFSPFFRQFYFMFLKRFLYCLFYLFYAFLIFLQRVCLDFRNNICT